jgi:predicted nucleic-acid-binding Zn-ribbon protein
MRKSIQCPKCERRRILHVAMVEDASSDVWSGQIAVRHERSWTGRVKQSVGALELYMCASCGYAEWYVVDPGKVVPDGATIRELPLPPPGGEYR